MKSFNISVIGFPKSYEEKNAENAGEKEAIRNEKPESKLFSKASILNMLVLGMAELVGTAILLFLGCMGCVVRPGEAPTPHYVAAISFGLVIMLIIQTFGSISGGHLNPAVTLASVLLGLLKPILGVVYVIAQFIGALLGFGLLKVLIPAEYTANEQFNPITNLTEHKTGLCSTVLHPKVSVMQGLMMELVLTFILILICAAVWDKRNSDNTDSLPLRFGLAIAAIAMVAGPYTGVSLNTPRSFSPALYNNDWAGHWIYWVGPNLGAIIAVYFYKTIFALPSEQETEDSFNPESSPLKEKIEFTNNAI